jgi:hypothetical protein
MCPKGRTGSTAKRNGASVEDGVQWIRPGKAGHWRKIPRRNWMKKIWLIIAAVLLVGGSSVAASAQRGGPYRHPRPPQHGINGRQYRQNRRIVQGLHTNRLNDRQAARLSRREARIARAERRDRRSGGGLSGSERKNLNRRLNRANRQIRRDERHRHGAHRRLIRIGR